MCHASKATGSYTNASEATTSRSSESRSRPAGTAQLTPGTGVWTVPPEPNAVSMVPPAWYLERRMFTLFSVVAATTNRSPPTGVIALRRSTRPMPPAVPKPGSSVPSAAKRTTEETEGSLPLPWPTTSAPPSGVTEGRVERAVGVVAGDRELARRGHAGGADRDEPAVGLHGDVLRRGPARGERGDGVPRGVEARIEVARIGRRGGCCAEDREQPRHLPSLSPLAPQRQCLRASGSALTFV